MSTINRGIERVTHLREPLSSSPFIGTFFDSVEESKHLGASLSNSSLSRSSRALFSSSVEGIHISTAAFASLFARAFLPTAKVSSAFQFALPLVEFKERGKQR